LTGCKPWNGSKIINAPCDVNTCYRICPPCPATHLPEGVQSSTGEMPGG
jgi:hypothetical protein